MKSKPKRQDSLVPVTEGALVVGLTLVGAVPWTFINVLKNLYALTRNWERRDFDDIVLSVVVLVAGY